jgi:hypothetical protein
MVRGRTATVIVGAIPLAALGSAERAGAAARAVFAVEVEGSVATTSTVPEREVGGCRYFGYSVTRPLHFWSERAARVVVVRARRQERTTLYRGTVLRPVTSSGIVGRRP